MFKRKLLTTALALTVAVSPITASAGSDALIGGIIGGVLGGAIANSNKKTTTTKRVYKNSGVSSATRAANRETQTALNYFSFNAGTPDGVMGRRSRTAISSYQAHMQYPVTGSLTQYERDFLINSYYRAQSGGPTTSELIASNPQGIRGLLIVYRDEQMNGSSGLATASIGGHYGLPKVVAAAVNEIAKSSDPSAEQLVQRSGFIQLSDINGDGQTDYILDTSVTGSAFWCNAQSCAVRVFSSTPDGYERNDFQAFNVTPAMFTCQRGNCVKTDGPVTQMASAPSMIQPTPTLPQTQMAAAPNGASAPVPSAVPAVQNPAMAAAQPVMPNFFGGQQSAPSLASYCNKVNLLTSTNGGFTTEGNMTDPNLALGEQMCLARTYAISNGEELAAKVQGATPDQIVAQCKQFAPLLKEQVSAVSLQPREDVIRSVAGFVLSTGMAPDQLEMTARICLSVGYRTDDMGVAMGSGLLLVALGQAPYAELLGHHLSQGYGATERGDLALAWYGHAFDALGNGATAVFAPGQPERLGLLKKASMMLNGNAGMAAPVTQPVQAGLPMFSISK